MLFGGTLPIAESLQLKVINKKKVRVLHCLDAVPPIHEVLGISLLCAVVMQGDGADKGLHYCCWCSESVAGGAAGKQDCGRGGAGVAVRGSEAFRTLRVKLREKNTGLGSNHKLYTHWSTLHLTTGKRFSSELCRNEGFLYIKDATWHVPWVVSFYLWQSSLTQRVSVPTVPPLCLPPAPHFFLKAPQPRVCFVQVRMLSSAC